MRRERRDSRDRNRDRDHRGGDRDFKRSFPGKRPTKFHIPKGTKVDYKDLNLLQKYVTDRGKILSRRFTGVTAKEQRALVREIKKQDFLVY